MYKWVCDICEREKPDYYLKPPYSYYSFSEGSYCPFCHRDTYNHPVDENGKRVPYPTEKPKKPNSQEYRLYRDSEEYERMKTKWAQVNERNMEIRKKDEKQIMDYVANVKNIRRRKRWRW